ncbi:MAG TPA: CPBP family intramembrane metalloprotease, partial [Phnomibacter sp.]|nr:CPBP family intramembrane metalloprotease [Phnomibacter sp.]
MSVLLNKGFRGWAQLAIFLGLLGVGMIAGSLISAGMWVALTGQNFASMGTDLLNPAYATPLKIVQAISTFFIFFLPAVLYASIVYRPPARALGIGVAPFSAALLGISVLCLVCMGPITDALGTLNRQIPLSASAKTFFDNLEKTYEEQVKAIGNVTSFGQYMLSLIMIALLPAVFEEVLFRGGLQGMLARWWKKPLLALVITSIVFSAIHGSWYGFLPRVALGLLLGGVFLITQNLIYPIILHFINNAIVVTYMYYLAIKGKPIDVGST